MGTVVPQMVAGSGVFPAVAGVFVSTVTELETVNVAPSTVVPAFGIESQPRVTPQSHVSQGTVMDAVLPLMLSACGVLPATSQKKYGCADVPAGMATLIASVAA